MERFCGNQLWDARELDDSHWPKLTPCFRVTFLYWIPVFFLLFAGVCYGKGLKNINIRCETAKLTWLFVCRLSLTTFLAVLSFTCATFPSSLSPAYVVSPVLRGISITCTVVMLIVDNKTRRSNNGYLCLFWLVSVVCQVVDLYSELVERTYSGLWFGSVYITFTVSVALLALSNLVEPFAPTDQFNMPGHPKPCPIDKSPFFSYLTFHWMTALMYKGYTNKTSLTSSDLWAITPGLRVERDVEEFLRRWREEKSRLNRKKKQFQEEHEEEHVYLKIVPVRETDEVKNRPCGEDNEKGSDSEDKWTPSLYRLLIGQFGTGLLQAWSCKFAYDILQFGNPLLLKALIDFVASDDPLWQGCVYALGLATIGVMMTMLFHQLFYLGQSVGLRIKNALTSAIYQKALVLDADGRSRSVGEVMNLMSVDTERVNMACAYLWILWSAPLQMLIAMTLLYFILEEAMFGGLAVLCLSIPVNIVIGRIQRNLQICQMTFKDQRLKQISEMLNGILVIKLYAWEPPFISKITKTRNKEASFLKKAAYLNAIHVFMFSMLPVLIMITSFLIYVYVLGQPLTADVAFVSSALFNILRGPLNLFPMVISMTVQLFVSLNRIARFLNSGELDPTSVTHTDNADRPITVEDAHLKWSQRSPVYLSGVNLSLRKGSLTAIVGQVGAGKSSLVTALLGDLYKDGGRINISGSTAYVPQQAWIQNMTLRDNILFGADHDPDRYERVLEGCCLQPDIAILPGGDLSEIGENGTNLSGGQKQRVSLARAVYQDCDIYILDDPLSAVDSHVGKDLFDNVIGNSDGSLLKDKTRVLVTHGVSFIKNADHVIFMKDGNIQLQGSYSALILESEEFRLFVDSAEKLQEEQEEEEGGEEVDDREGEQEERMRRRSTHTSVFSHPLSSPPHGDMGSEHRPDFVPPPSTHSSVTRRTTHKSLRSRHSLYSIDSSAGTEFDWTIHNENDAMSYERRDSDEAGQGRLTDVELEEQGNINMAVVCTYLRAIGLRKLVASCVLFGLFFVCVIASQMWLSEWADWSSGQLEEDPGAEVSAESEQHVFAAVYGALAFAMAVFILAYGFIFCVALVQASVKLHYSLLSNMARCPMSFFDTTQSGRIVNRFSKDVEVTDNTLPQIMRSLLLTGMNLVSIFVMISYTTPWFLVLLVVLMCLYFFIQRFYVRTSRQLKRIESTTRSPMFNHFSETLRGPTVIRAYGAQHRFVHEMHARINENNIYYYAGVICAPRWLGIRLECLGNVIVLSAALLAVFFRDSLSPGLAGLSISSSLMVTNSLNWTVRMISELETCIVSVERIKEYSEKPNEAAWRVEATTPPDSWPEHGVVKFTNYSTRYRKDLDLVLNQISFETNENERIGIVGRTGAGKSSLTLALFRIIEAVDGYIEIDGRRIEQLGLHELRSRITILPQDPVLFSGTLRENLDPFKKHDDASLAATLRSAHLDQFETNLDLDVGEGGSNLSVGQRQLVCLARALLGKSKILVLDEATAAVDLQTDKLIQETIREMFADCTILTIAHRLHTILDYDRVIVLNAGRVAELDTVGRLLADHQSAFHAMARDAGGIVE